MKTTKLFFMAALALTFAACSNDDNDLTTQQPAEAQGIPFTATISMGGDKATTRALSENGSGGLTATWTVDEEVALIHNGIIDKVKVASVSGNVATISGTITTDDDGVEVTVIFPYSAVDLVTKDVKAELLYTQSGGTLADVAAKYDVRKGDGTLKVDGTATLNGEVTLDNQFAIWKLMLNESAKDLYITAGGVLIAGATRNSEGEEFFVAVPAVDSKTVAAVATDESSNSWYFSKAGVSLAAGKYYQSSPTMTALETDDNTEAVYEMTEADDIPDGKTVVLNGVTCGKITCSGDATIILVGTNELDEGLQASPWGKTMTITGTGSLNARSNGYNPGIGAVESDCGNIIICGGTITAQPGNLDGEGAGIGSGERGTCGNITICGGTVTATGGVGGAGIGSGVKACGTVTITDGATKVTATKGSDAENSIGKGVGSCGTVTIDGVVNATTSSTFEHFESDVSGNTWTLTHK